MTVTQQKPFIYIQEVADIDQQSENKKIIVTWSAAD